METILKAERRDGAGKGVARKLRARGRVPGILYGHGMAPISLHVGSQDLLHLFHASTGTNVLVDLEIDGSTHLALPREIQRDHIHSRYLHIDFLAVRRDEKVKVIVEVHEVGEAPGVKMGGVVEHHLREVELECLPSDVPDSLEVDISSLEIGDMLKVVDIIVPDGTEILTDPDSAVISIITPAALRTEADLTLPGEEAVVVEEPAEAEEGEVPEEGAPAEPEGGEG
jgi:large subunit ribosomal protein L25